MFMYNFYIQSKILFYNATRKLFNKKSIIDTTGTLLTPGNNGKDCTGNIEYNPLSEICCDECDYMMCCLPEHNSNECKNCLDSMCPHSKKYNS